MEAINILYELKEISKIKINYILWYNFIEVEDEKQNKIKRKNNDYYLSNIFI